MEKCTSCIDEKIYGDLEDELAFLLGTLSLDWLQGMIVIET